MLKANIIDHLSLIQRALQLAEEVLNGEEFRNAILQCTLPSGERSFHFDQYVCGKIFKGRKKVIRLPKFSNEDVHDKI